MSAQQEGLTASSQDDALRAALELLLHRVPAMTWAVDRELRVIDRELGDPRAIEQILGAERRAPTGMTLFEYFGTADATFLPIAKHFEALAGAQVSYEFAFAGRLLATSLGPLRDGTGTIIGVIGISLDITAARDVERRVIEHEHAESLRVLAGGVAHDFNNLLVAVLGHADLAMRDPSASANVQRSLAQITTAARRAADLTHQLMAYAGSPSHLPGRVDACAIAHECLSLLSTTWAPACHVTMTTEGHELWIAGDPSQVRRVILNLVSNARDAIAERGGEVRLVLRRCRHEGSSDPGDVLPTSPGAYLALEVADDGPGIAAESVRRIFEPFFTTKALGNGLGLAAVHGLVRANHGGIRVQSAPGHGALFTVLWPLADERLGGARVAVLLVDPSGDEGLREELEAQGAEVILVLSPTMATAVLGQPEVRVDVLVVSELLGPAHARRLRDQALSVRPDLVALAVARAGSDGLATIVVDAVAVVPRGAIGRAVIDRPAR